MGQVFKMAAITRITKRANHEEYLFIVSPIGSDCQLFEPSMMYGFRDLGETSPVYHSVNGASIKNGCHSANHEVCQAQEIPVHRQCDR